MSQSTSQARRRRREHTQEDDNGTSETNETHTNGDEPRRIKRHRSTSETVEDVPSRKSHSSPNISTPPPRLSIPYRSTWFRLESIDKIEKRSLPDFFTRKQHFKTEQIYKEYRDWMISTYRLHPDRYLSGTVARKALCGDAGSILRIHSFLQFWGLINHNVPAHSTEPSTSSFALTDTSTSTATSSSSTTTTTDDSTKNDTQTSSSDESSREKRSRRARKST